MQKSTIEKDIELLKFKHSVAEKFIHTIFNANLKRQLFIIGSGITTLQISLQEVFPIKSIFLQVDIILLTIILLVLSELNYKKSTSKISKHAILLEDEITKNYKELGR